jgi:hypothetical protein
MARTLRYSAQQVIDALTQTKGLVYLAAKSLGCDGNTVQSYCKRFPSVQAAKEAARGRLLDEAELRLWRAVQDGAPWAITFVLSRLGKHRGYVERHEQAGADGQLVTLRVVYETPPPVDLPQAQPQPPAARNGRA